MVSDSQVVIIDVPDIQILPLPKINKIASKEEQKVQDLIPLEHRTELISHRGFRDIIIYMSLLSLKDFLKYKINI